MIPIILAQTSESVKGKLLRTQRDGIEKNIRIGSPICREVAIEGMSSFLRWKSP